jgi:hypothetical protein
VRKHFEKAGLFLTQNMRTQKSAAPAATQTKRKPLVRSAPKAPAINTDRKSITVEVTFETLALLSKLAKQKGVPQDHLIDSRINEACRAAGLFLTSADFAGIARECRKAERSALVHELPTTKIYTSTSQKLDELAKASGMSRCSLATYSLDYTLAKLESGELKISDNEGPINFTAAV